MKKTILSLFLIAGLDAVCARAGQAKAEAGFESTAV